MTGMVPLLAVEGLVRNFSGLRALDDCSFTLQEGRTSCLIGPNGAGKTTLFDVITGFLQPDAGTVRFKGEPITGSSRRSIVKKGIARSFQNLRLFAEMTVLDNVIVCLADERGNDPVTSMFRPFYSQAVLRKKTDRAREILQVVGLQHKADDVAMRLSFGQQKLLCIARVLATDATLLLLDEPTSGLSAGALDSITAIIRRLSGAGKTLLVIEHNTQIVREIADTIIFMHQGHAVASGDPDAVLRRSDLAEIYFGGAIQDPAA